MKKATQSRPAIPRPLARRILIESGHRCAVCGESCSLEKAHIVPWCKTRDHSAKNLICLCATCHHRADHEKWGAATLRSYKKRPWILRSRNSDSPVKKIVPVELICSLEVSDYDEKAERFLIHALASFLEISPTEITVRRVLEGSLRIVVEIPEEVAQRLKSIDDTGDSSLDSSFWAETAPLGLDEIRFPVQQWGASIEVPFLGQIAAGDPVATVVSQETIEIPQSMTVGRYEDYFVLRASGRSLAEAGVNDGDLLVCEKTNVAREGDLAIIIVGNDTLTVKFLQPEGSTVSLVPANQHMPILREPASNIRVSGRVVGLMRDFI